LQPSPAGDALHIAADTPTVDESNIYYVYSTAKTDLLRIPKTSRGLDKDLEDNVTTTIPAGTRMRLHYPMEMRKGCCYMTEASVHSDTGLFQMSYVCVYKESVDGMPPTRYVTDFDI
jgi:hypothetical protein